MNRSYKKGYRFERRVKTYLEKKGYRVFRLAGSKPADLIAINNETIYIVECKSNKYIRKEAKTKLIELSKDTMAKPIIAINRNRKILFIDPIKENKIDL